MLRIFEGDKFLLAAFLEKVLSINNKINISIEAAIRLNILNEANHSFYNCN